jgi:hypothetical protein
MRIKKLLLATLSSGLIACGASNEGVSPEIGADGQLQHPTNPKSPITIDNTGVVPAFNDSVSSVKVYLHNNTDQEIKNIHYSWEANLPENSKRSFLEINQLTSDSLSSVTPNGVLALPVNIPSFQGSSIGKGSALLKVSYTYGGKNYSFNHVVDFRLMQGNESGGVQITSGSISSSFGNNGSGFTTLYIYGSGAPGTTYDITDINIDPALGNVVQGNLKGSKLAARQVATIELNTLVANKDISGLLTVSSQYTNNQQAKSAFSLKKNVFTSSKEVVVLGANDESPLVTTSLVPFLDTSSTTASKVFFYNAGTGKAVLNNVNGTTGISNLKVDSSCSNGFDPGQVCVVNFNVPASSIGSGKITASTTGEIQNLETPVTWYNSLANMPQLGLTSDVDTVGLLLQKVSGASLYNSVAHITVTNLTDIIPIKNIAIKSPQVKSGHAVASIVADSDECSGKVLDKNQASCTYNVSVNDSFSPDSGLINFEVIGDANGAVVSGFDSIQYRVYKPTAQLALAFNPASLTIEGNNVESALAKLTITNIGTTSSEDIEKLNVQPVYKSITGNPLYTTTSQCNNKPLLHKQSCQEIIKLDPQYNKSNLALQASLDYSVSVEDGSVFLAKDPLLLTVQPYNKAIVLDSITQKGNSGGDGKESTMAVKFLAGNDTDKAVVLTYKNISTTETAVVNGVNFAGGLPAGWEIKQDETSCYGGISSSGKVLIPNEFCTITLENKLNLLGDSNSVTNLSFDFPKLVISGLNLKNYYTFVPSNQLGYKDDRYYANNYQAIITDTATVKNNGTDSAELKITHTTTGVKDGGYDSSRIIEKTQITPQIYIGQGANLDTHCTLDNISGAVIENCTLSDEYAVSNSYKLSYATENMAGIDPDEGGKLTINYIDLLSGKAWAFNNNPNITSGANVNGGGTYLSLDPKLSASESVGFIFGGYSQWLYKDTDNTLYAFKNNEQNGAVFDDNGYISKITSSLFSGGVNAVDSFRNKVFVATGNNSNRVVSCSFNRNTGALSMDSCEKFDNISMNTDSNLVDLAIFNGWLYVLDDNTGVTVCQLAKDGGIVRESCQKTALDSSVEVGPKNQGKGRQQHMMFWDGYLVRSYLNSGGVMPIYEACRQMPNGLLVGCKKISLSLSGYRMGATHSDVLIPRDDNYAYLVINTRTSDELSQKIIYLLNKSESGSIKYLASDARSIAQLPDALSWGEGLSNPNAYLGDNYMIYYHSKTRHLIGTISTSQEYDGDIIGKYGYHAYGQEFYFSPNFDFETNQFQQPDGITYKRVTSEVPEQEVNKEVSFSTISSSYYNKNLANQISGDVVGIYGGKIVLDTLSIH